MTEVWTLEQYHAYMASGDMPATKPQPFIVDPEASEKDLQGKLHMLALTRGWYFYHTYKSLRSTPGWPDVALCHPQGGPLYLWELKDAKGQLSGAQRGWLEALQKVTRVEIGIYRPSDWDIILSKLGVREQNR